jgi:hypothetical protein
MDHLEARSSSIRLRGLQKDMILRKVRKLSRNRKMVIVFFGTPQFAVPTLEALLASAPSGDARVTQPDKRRDRGQKVSDAPVKAAALAHNVPVFQPERLRDPAVADTLVARDRPGRGRRLRQAHSGRSTGCCHAGDAQRHASLLPKLSRRRAYPSLDHQRRR